MTQQIKKEPNAFCQEQLSSYIKAISKEYELREIDEVLYHEIIKLEWARDLCSVFADYADYKQNGIGFVVLCHGSIVAGASSYTVYNGGIEIEIDTKESYRRRGLALASGAALISRCLDMGCYPGWDAHDMRSVKLAEKLGYHMEREYTAYELLAK